MTQSTKLQATKEIRVFIDKKRTDISKIPESKRENLSWKGCYYTIMPTEVFYFDRSNNWDASYFKLENGAEFKIDCGNFMDFVKSKSVNICHPKI